METSLDSLSLRNPAFGSGEDPWVEFIQSGCEDLQEAETIQPLLFTPAALEQVLSKIWAQSVLTGGSLQIAPILLKSSLTNIFQRLDAVRFLFPKKPGSVTPPLSPIQLSSGAALSGVGMGLPPLAELCELALLWAIAGETKAAEALTSWLLNFALKKPLLSLWCLENKYNEKKGLLSFSLLLRSSGQFEKSKELLKLVRPPIPAFFIALAKKAPLLSVIAPSSSVFSDLLTGLSLSVSDRMTAALTLSGQETSMGMVRAGEIEIRAFGPQKLPLNELNGFGIHRIPDGSPIAGWTRSFALPEVWIEAKLKTLDSSCHLDLHFVGLKPETPLGFVFYLKAENCQVGSEIYLPKSLKRYSGQATSLIFGSKGSKLKIESGYLHKLQVIPLAGEGCFWEAEFLVSFEINPFEAKASFVIENQKI
ncbi:MAG: hypothetical protein V4487_05830 [Chlamydiota bacterium]